MTHADRIEGEGLCLELDQLWMLPLILLQMICAWFADERQALKRLRDRTPRGDLWREHYWSLRQCEWDIRVMLAEGARRILAGEAIDLPAILIPPPPEGWRPAMPQSSRAMCLRFEDVAAFHADPEAFITRHAARLKRRRDDEALVSQSENALGPHGEQHPPRPVAQSQGRGLPPPDAHIRAPP
jgi:hypothetical protein